MSCCVIVLMFLWVHAICSLLILVFGWMGGGMGGISPFSGFVAIDSNVIVLTMFSASIDGFCFSGSLLRANFSIVFFVFLV